MHCASETTTAPLELKRNCRTLSYSRVFCHATRDTLGDIDNSYDHKTDSYHIDEVIMSVSVSHWRLHSLPQPLDRRRRVVGRFGRRLHLDPNLEPEARQR